MQDYPASPSARTPAQDRAYQAMLQGGVQSRPASNRGGFSQDLLRQWQDASRSPQSGQAEALMDFENQAIQTGNFAAVWGLHNFPYENVRRALPSASDVARGRTIHPMGIASYGSGGPRTTGLEQFLSESNARYLYDPSTTPPASSLDQSIITTVEPGNPEYIQTTNHELQHHAGREFSPLHRQGPNSALHEQGFYDPNNRNPGLPVGMADELYAAMQDIIGSASAKDSDYRVDVTNEQMRLLQMGGDPIDPSRPNEFARIRAVLDAYHQPFLEDSNLGPNFDPRERSPRAYEDPWRQPTHR